MVKGYWPCVVDLIVGRHHSETFWGAWTVDRNGSKLAVLEVWDGQLSGDHIENYPISTSTSMPAQSIDGEVFHCHYTGNVNLVLPYSCCKRRLLQQEPNGLPEPQIHGASDGVFKSDAKSCGVSFPSQMRPSDLTQTLVFNIHMATASR